MPPGGGDDGHHNRQQQVVRIKAAMKDGVGRLRSARRHLLLHRQIPLLLASLEGFFRRRRRPAAAAAGQPLRRLVQHTDGPRVLADVAEWLAASECLRLGAVNSLLRDLVFLRLQHPEKVSER
jgi:hypothetical protein